MICAVNIKFEFNTHSTHHLTMGNQTSSHANGATAALQQLLKPNKHFSNQSIRNLPQQNLLQLINDLNIDASILLSTNLATNQYSLNSMIFNQDFSFEKISHRLTWRTASQHPHIFNIHKLKIQQHKNLCSLSRKIYVSQDAYHFTLKDLIQHKITDKKSFSQSEILTLLTKITSAIVWMHDNEFKNIPLDSEAIFFVADSAPQLASSDTQFDHFTCKVIDQDLVQTNSYKMFLETLAEAKHQPQNQTKKPSLQIYLSPQLLQQAKASNFYPANFSLKSDIFTLGMIIMEICCQEEMYFCYNLDHLTFDYESLIHRIAKISYSNELKLLLAEMLEYDQNNRIGFVSLKEKLSKLIVKPFEETRKLKRRSSSTMLKELLSCSRATASLQSKKPTQKHGFSRISTLSQSNKKIQQNLKPQNASNQAQTADHSLRKSNSLVNLKCKTNSFLTSKKSTLMRVNSNSKLQTDARKLNDLSCQASKVDYKSILKNRAKTESRLFQCPQGQKINQSLSSSELNFQQGQNSPQPRSVKQTFNLKKQAQEVNNKKENKQVFADENQNINNHNATLDPQVTSAQKLTCGNLQKSLILNQKPKESSKLSYIQKKVINLDNLNFSSSNHKLHDSNHPETNHNQKNASSKLTKQSHPAFPKQSSITGKITKYVPNLSIQKNDESKPKRNAQTNSSSIEECSIGPSNKNWIMGKLKSNNEPCKKVDTSISNLILAKKDKSSSNKKKQSSLTKHKTISLANLATQPFNANLQAQIIESNPAENSIQKIVKPFSSNEQSNGFTQTKQLNLFSSNDWNKNDTIIKRLELTEEKPLLAASGFNDKTSTINDNIQEQMELINRVLEKCQLSSSRWQDESQKFDFKGYQTERILQFQALPRSSTIIPLSHQPIAEKNTQKNIAEEREDKVQKSERVSQFKKKSKVIDIDLGNFSIQNKDQTKEKNESSKRTKESMKEEKKPCSKLQKLKQLTIITEDSGSNNEEMQQRFNQRNQTSIYENKENNMLNSNLPNLALNKLQNSDKFIKNLKNPSQTQFSYHNHQMHNFNPIPRIEQVNLASVNPSLITPHSLNDLNKFYGKGITFESQEQSFGSTLHRKDFSTLSKPFQQIELDYANTEPLIGSPNLPKQFQQPRQQKQIPEEEYHPKQSTGLHTQKSSQHSSIKKDNCLYSINAEQLTFRLRPKNSEGQKDGKAKRKQKIHKISFFEKEDGSFLMREQNPIKNIQTSSIIGQDRTGNTQRNTIEELFKQSSKFYDGLNSCNELKESFYEENQDNSQKMNSSCDSINLSEIECQAQQGGSFIYPEAMNSHERRRKYKHVSILESGDESFENPKKISMNLKNLKQITERNESQIQSTNRHSEYDTYRGYLSSNKVTSTIQLADNFVYEGQINKEGEFEGNGMISRKNGETGENDLIYTGSFMNGTYHGFGTLYEVERPEEKRLKLPITGKRMSFGQQRMQSKSQIKVDKYFLLSETPVKYEGEFVNGDESGFGTYTYENGDRYSGCIKDGVIEGYGTYHFSESGESISGIWKNNAYSEC